MDIGDVGDIHPKYKQEVGRRLALLALANTYGKRVTVSSGPVFKSLKIEGSTVVVSAASVPHPVAVRFGWNKVAEPNLCNAEKLPALPFRTGEVPLRDGLAHVA